MYQHFINWAGTGRKERSIFQPITLNHIIMIRTILTIVLMALLCSVSYGQIQSNEIQSTGRVGIGTTTPTEALEVEGKTKLEGELQVRDSAIVDGDVRVGQKLKVDQDIKVTGTSVFTGEVKARSDLKVLGEARLKSDLKVDGTSKLKGDVVVEGTFKLKDFADSTAFDDRFLIVNSNGKTKVVEKAGLISTVYQPALCLALADGTIPAYWSMRSTPSHGVLYTGFGGCEGRVGIGTDTPEADLDVRGTVNVSNRLKVGPASIFIGGVDAMTGSNNNVYATDVLYIQSNSTEPHNTIINYNNNGNVGIGMDAPVHKLEVAGTVRACKFIAETNSWCDEVFEPDYKLMSLRELEAYILEQKHLPGFPSEEEVIAQGNDLNNTDLLLLRKTEELTLYTIAQQKLIDELQEELTRLKGLLEN